MLQHYRLKQKARVMILVRQFQRHRLDICLRDGLSVVVMILLHIGIIDSLCVLCIVYTAFDLFGCNGFIHFKIYFFSFSFHFFCVCRPWLKKLILSLRYCHYLNHLNHDCLLRLTTWPPTMSVPFELSLSLGSHNSNHLYHLSMSLWTVMWFVVDDCSNSSCHPEFFFRIDACIIPIFASYACI